MGKNADSERKKKGHLMRKSMAEAGRRQALKMAFRRDGFLAPHPGWFLSELRSSCKELFDLADDTNRLAMRTCWQLAPSTSDRARVTATLLFIKAVNSYQAAMLLASRGLSVESLSITRTGMECAIVLSAVADDPLHTEQLAIEHDRHLAIHAAKILELYTRKGFTAQPEVMTALRHAAASKTTEKQGRGKYAGLKLEQLAERVGLGSLYQTSYRGASGSAAHATAGALHKLVAFDKEGQLVQAIMGVDMEELPSALTTAIPVMLECFTPISAMFSLPSIQFESTELALRLHNLLNRS